MIEIAYQILREWNEAFSMLFYRNTMAAMDNQISCCLTCL